MLRISIQCAPLALLFTLLGSVPAARAQVLRVGPGRPYADIGAAVSAAPTGGLILVDAGSYPPFDIVAKEVAVLRATAQPFSIQASPTRPAVRIQGLAAGRSITLLGWNTTVAFGAAPALEIRGCAGSVRIDEATILPTANLPGARLRGAVEIVDSTSVWFSSVQIASATPRAGTTTSAIPAPSGTNEGISAVVAERSVIHLQDAQLRGYDNSTSPGAGRHGGDALRLLGASTAFIQGDSAWLRGGTGGEFGGNAVHLIATTPVQKVSACATAPGTFSPGPGPQRGGVFAINHDRGIVQSGPLAYDRLVPSCLYESYGAISTSALVHQNTTHTVTLSSRFPRPFLLFLGPTAFAARPLPAVQNPPLLDYLSPWTTLIAAGALSSPPQVSFAIPVPADPALAGAQFGIQALLGPPAGMPQPALSFSLAAILVITL